MQGYSELRLPRLTPLIYDYCQDLDPKNSIDKSLGLSFLAMYELHHRPILGATGSFYPEYVPITFGYSVVHTLLDNLFREVPSSTDVAPEKFTDLQRIYYICELLQHPILTDLTLLT